MHEIEYKILKNEPLTDDIFEMVLDGDTRDITKPGQFINITIPGKFLRRPISVCDWEDGRLTIIYKVVGEGTEGLSYMEEGEYLKALSGLGNGYDVSLSPARPVVAGGGVGIPPMVALTKKLIEAGKHPYVALGFNTEADMFYVDEFRALGVPVNVATVDGSVGAKGFVTDILGDHDYAFCCGPMPMLKAVYGKVHGGQFSFEERRGCGFGACMGCSTKVKGGYKRICKDGPVLSWEEIEW